MSKSVVIQGAQVGAIPSLAQGSKTYTPGRGSKKHVQGLVTVRALYDKPTLKRHNETAATRSTVFPKPVTDESLDVVEDEFCFMTKVPRSDVSEDKHSLHIGSSLNGIGADVAEAYPGDAEVQRVATRNRIKYAGIARDTVDYTSGNKRQGLALGIAGESTHFADNDLAPGQLAELIVPLPGKNSTGSYVRKPYVPEGKVTLELAPYAPKNLETRVQAVMRAFTENEDKFRKAMDPKYRTTLMWANVYESWWNHIVTSWAILTKTLQVKKKDSPPHPYSLIFFLPARMHKSFNPSKPTVVDCTTFQATVKRSSETLQTRLEPLPN